MSHSCLCFSVRENLRHTTLTTATITTPTTRPQRRLRDHAYQDQSHFPFISSADEKHHNADYDHDAFLGREEAQTFDELSPEESKERLGKIVAKIDKDSDGKVTEAELKVSARFSADREIIQPCFHLQGISRQLSYK